MIPTIQWQFGGLDRPTKCKEIHSALSLKSNVSAFGTWFCRFSRCLGACVRLNLYLGVPGLLWAGIMKGASSFICPCARSQLLTKPFQRKLESGHEAYTAISWKILSWGGRARASGSQVWYAGPSLQLPVDCSSVPGSLLPV